MFTRLERWLKHREIPNRFYTLKQRFTSVYNTNEWGDASGRVPRSGLGSTIANTVGVRATVVSAALRLFEGQETLRLVDAPCGDMTWMPLLLGDLSNHFANVDYVGVDIVDALIEANRRLPNPTTNVSMRFECMDITRRALPAGDLFFCKELVNHLTNRDVSRLLKRLHASELRYAMITSNIGWDNVELPPKGTGASRHVDLQKPPFRLPPPILGDGYLSVWKLPFEEFDPDRLA